MNEAPPITEYSWQTREGRNHAMSAPEQRAFDDVLEEREEAEIRRRLSQTFSEN
jgi:hypothetical protein